MARGWRYINPSLASALYRVVPVRACVMYLCYSMGSLRVSAPNLSFLLSAFWMSTKETLTMADLQRLRTDPNRRCQVPNTMRATLPLILNDTCISDIATKMADVMLPTAVELAPRSKRPRGAQGWRAGPGGEVEKDEAWKQRKGVRRRLRADPHSRNIRKPWRLLARIFVRFVRLPC